MAEQQENAPPPTISHPRPSLGRVVHFYAHRDAQPETAVICSVVDPNAGPDDPRATVNLDVTSYDGKHRAELGVDVEASPDGRNEAQGRHYRWPAHVAPGARATRGTT